LPFACTEARAFLLDHCAVVLALADALTEFRSLSGGEIARRVKGG
jgi:hypothetical protein